MLKRTKALVVHLCAFLTLPAHRSLSARPVGGEASLPSELVLAALLLCRTSDLAKLEVTSRFCLVWFHHFLPGLFPCFDLIGCCSCLTAISVWSLILLVFVVRSCSGIVPDSGSARESYSGDALTGTFLGFQDPSQASRLLIWVWCCDAFVLPAAEKFPYERMCSWMDHSEVCVCVLLRCPAGTDENEMQDYASVINISFSVS
jgi:hypothetical protein